MSAKKNYWEVICIDRDYLLECGYNTNVDDKTMERLANMVGEYFDELLQDAVMQSAKSLGIEETTIMN